MKPEAFKPEVGTVYNASCGGRYVCTGVWPNDTVEQSWCARLTNLETGWSIAAHGLRKGPDGKIEWDYSTGGRFA